MPFLLALLIALNWHIPAFAGPQQVRDTEAEAEQAKQTYRFIFGDTIKDHANAAALRDKLTQIVKDKDAEAMLNLMQPNLLLSFGPMKLKDKDDLRKTMAFDENAEDSHFWHEIEPILSLGGTADDNEIIMPWLAAYDFPQSDWTLHDEANQGNGLYNSFVTTQATPLFENDDKDGAIIRMLKPYETLLIVIDKDDNCEAYRTHDSLKGCVNPAHVRSPLDYRARFRQYDGEWKLDSFIAGE